MKSNTGKHQTAHGNEPHLRKTTKHDVNLQKNETLRFQVGLLFSLAIAYVVMETTFAATGPVEMNAAPLVDKDNTFVMDDFMVEKDPKSMVPTKENVALPSYEQPEVVPDNARLDDRRKEYNSEPSGDSDLNVHDIKYEAPVVDPGPIDFEVVEFVPIFPGCESLSTNKERKECMSDQINKIVKKNFNVDLAAKYGLSGTQKIFVQFKINKTGHVSDVLVRAPHKALEEEAKRVAGLIPQMKPGKQRDMDVEVVFLKPIIFKVQ